MITIAIIAAIVYAAFHLGAGHAHYRYRKARGLNPNFYWSSVRGRVRQRPAAWRVPRRPPPVTKPTSRQQGPAPPSGAGVTGMSYRRLRSLRTRNRIPAASGSMLDHAMPTVAWPAAPVYDHCHAYDYVAGCALQRLQHHHGRARRTTSSGGLVPLKGGRTADRTRSGPPVSSWGLFGVFRVRADNSCYNLVCQGRPGCPTNRVCRISDVIMAAATGAMINISEIKQPERARIAVSA